MEKKRWLLLLVAGLSILALTLSGIADDGDEGREKVLMDIMYEEAEAIGVQPLFPELATLNQAIDEILAKVAKQGLYQGLESDLTHLRDLRRAYTKSVGFDGHSGSDLYKNLRAVDMQLDQLESVVNDPVAFDEFYSAMISGKITSEDKIAHAISELGNKASKLPDIGYASMEPLHSTLHYMNCSIFQFPLTTWEKQDIPPPPTSEVSWLDKHLKTLRKFRDSYVSDLPRVSTVVGEGLLFSEWYHLLDRMDAHLEYTIKYADGSHPRAVVHVGDGLRNLQYWKSKLEKALLGY